MNQSIWLAGGKRSAPSHPSLTSDLEVEVVVVGAGITGLTLGALLTAKGVRTAILERGRVGSGTSGRTTAHATVALDLDYGTLIARFGEEAARLVVGSVQRSIEEIELHAKHAEWDCGFRRVPGFRFTEDPAAVDALEAETGAAQLLGLDAGLVQEIPLPVDCAAAIRFERQAEFDPVAYLHALVAEYLANGGLLFEESPVIDADDNGVVVAGGRRVRAGFVIDATHTPIGLVPLIQTRLTSHTSYVIAARLDSPVARGLYWDDADPYHYLRTFGGDDPCILVGGEDHPTGRIREALDPLHALEIWTRARFSVRSIDAGWSHEWFDPADGLPYIGFLPGSEHRLVATGFSGTGVTFGTVAALVLCDLVTKRSSTWESLYTPSRVKPMAATLGAVREGVGAGWRWVADRLRADTTGGMGSLARESGRVERIDGEQVAVYRDVRGDLHFLSPRCTHMGCIVAWNAVENTWDCPCHGGRFHPTGKVLYGPPLTDLEHDPLGDE